MRRAFQRRPNVCTHHLRLTPWNLRLRRTIRRHVDNTCDANVYVAAAKTITAPVRVEGDSSQLAHGSPPGFASRVASLPSMTRNPAVIRRPTAERHREFASGWRSVETKRERGGARGGRERCDELPRRSAPRIDRRMGRAGSETAPYCKAEILAAAWRARSSAGVRARSKTASPPKRPIVASPSILPTA